MFYNIMFICNFCQKTFVKKQGLDYHVTRKVCFKLWKTCNKCGHQFASKAMYQYHVTHNVCNSEQKNKIKLLIKNNMVLTHNDTTHSTKSDDQHINVEDPKIETKPTTDRINDLAKLIIMRLSKEQRDTLSDLLHCNKTDSVKIRNDKIFSQITNDNKLNQYLSTKDVDINALYILSLLSDASIDKLYKKITNNNTVVDRFSKMLVILNNQTCLMYPHQDDGKYTIPTKIRQSVWNQYIGQTTIGSCYCCGTTISSFDFEAGHVIADSLGGLPTIENLRPVCSSCNKSMHNQNMIDFVTKYYPNSAYSQESKLN